MFGDRKLFRDSTIARAKVHLAPWQNADLNQLSVQRVCYLINNRSLCVVEKSPDQEWLEHCFISEVTERWVERCVETLHREDREQLAQTFYERYREIRLEDQMQRLLDETFGNRSTPDLPVTVPVSSTRRALC